MKIRVLSVILFIEYTFFIGLNMPTGGYFNTTRCSWKKMIDEDGIVDNMILVLFDFPTGKCA